ncbi:MAG: REP-associated tyrosine transposase [Phycisphaerales bacterium]
MRAPEPPPQPLRKTSRRQRPDGGLHYLTFSCYRRLPLLGTARLRDAFVAALARAHKQHRFKLLAWVAMPEHVHIFLMPTAARGNDWSQGHGSSLPSILIGLKKPVAERVIGRWKDLRWNGLSSVADSRGRIHFWQPGGGFDRNVRDVAELVREVRYIHQNPVRRGLVEKAADWRWSSARWYAGAMNAGPDIDPVIVDGRTFPGPRPEVFVGDVP